MATNLAEIRKTKRLTTGALSDRLQALGRPILPTGITKIEKGSRRVDVDDLVALALALEVTPNRLLLPETTPEASLPPGEQPAAVVSLTPAVTVTAQDAWRWASGEVPLPVKLPWDDERTENFSRWQSFMRLNRPHDASQLTFEEVLAIRERLGDLWQTIKGESVRAGVPVASIADFIQMMHVWERITQPSVTSEGGDGGEGLD